MSILIDTKQSTFYPISLDDILRKVNRRLKTKNNSKQLPSSKISNVKEITNNFGEKITRVDGKIPINIKIENGKRFLFISYDQTAYSHGIHKYPAKFFPELPRWLIEKYSKKGDLILDPFSGSATTNVESLLLSRNSVGIDVDPFSRFIAKVKTTPLNEVELKKAKKEIINLVLNYNSEKVKEQDIPKFPYRDNWFNKEILHELAYIKKCISGLNCSQKTKNFFLVCFSSIIRAVSNADDNCTRTVIRKKLNKEIYPADALKKFAESILTNIPRMIDFSNECSKIHYAKFPKNMDARDIRYKENIFDLAVTSPPYVNAVDYPRTHQLEIYWLGFESGSLTTLKKQHVGTESVLHKDYKDLHKIGVRHADQIISKIYSVDKRRAYIAFKFLNDMKKNLGEVYRVLKPKGRYVVVIGNNRIRNNTFESWKYLIDIAEKVGFNLECYFGSEIIKHFIKVPREERIDTDWVLVLQK